MTCAYVRNIAVVGTAHCHAWPGISMARGASTASAAAASIDIPATAPGPGPMACNCRAAQLANAIIVDADHDSRYEVMGSL